MQLISHGAAREVTGTCHELRIGEKRILLDCGLFQGKRQEAALKNSMFDFDPRHIDAVVLSHAHMDHAGRIPLLYKKGYRGPVYCTYATQSLTQVMLRDSGYIQEKDEEWFRSHLAKSRVPHEGPLYTQKEAEECMSLFVGKNYGETFDVIPGLSATFLEAGHILGSAMVYMEVTGHGSRVTGNVSGSQLAARSLPLRVGFSGDLGRKNLPIIRDPADMPQVDIMICESTYGDRAHDDIESAKLQLKAIIEKTAARGGKVLIPAFSLERTQEIVYDLHLLWDAKQMPAVPIIIDSPLATNVTDVFMKHAECYDKEMYDQFLSRAHNPFQFSLVNHTDSVEESKELNLARGPIIIMAGSGMCEAGRIRHHLRNELDDPKNSFVAVGFMAENTLGRKILEPDTTEVKIFDEFVPKKAEIYSINAYSGHADKTDLDAYITAQKDLKKLYLVHGEEGAMAALKARMEGLKPGMDITMPIKDKEYLL